jgi:FHA domain
MPAVLTVDADLHFSVDIPGSPTVTGSLTGSGKKLELRVNNPALFAGRADSAVIKGVARALAERGLSVSVVSSSGPLVTLGATRTPWLQRLVTGSRHIRIERGGGLWTLARGRTRSPSGGVLPATALAPPPTLMPIAPTMARQSRRVTTTHDPDRGGNPRLFLSPGAHPFEGDPQTVYPLRNDVTTIGSGADCDIRLAGLEELHAEIRHDDADEFVLTPIGSTAEIRVNGAPVQRTILRTGYRIDLGGRALTFFREEYADHGRPYGGRSGGEFSEQRLQPSRKSVQRPVEEP